MAGYQPAGERPGTWSGALTAGMVATVRRIGSPRPSPDGAWVAYASTYDGRTDLYLVPSAGGLPRQLTTDRAVSGGNFAWTPDGRTIIYSSGGRLWRIAATGGPTRPVTDGAGRHLSPAVSSDGQLVAMTVDRDEAVDIGLVALSDTSDTVWPGRVSGGPDFASDPQWSPDTGMLAWMAYNNRLMPWDESGIVATVDGEARLIAGRPDRSHSQPRFSPDGLRLAFLSDRDGWLNVWLADLSGLGDGDHDRDRATFVPVRALAPEPREHGGPPWPYDVRDLAWSPDGRRIAHARNVDGRVSLALLDVDTERRAPLTDPALPGIHGQLSWCGSDAVICAYSAPATPPQIVRIAVPGGERTVLAEGAPLGIAAARPVAPEHLTYAATDGFTAHALLYTPRRPAGADGYPLLVDFHGGPTAQRQEGWDGVAHYFVARGWAVVGVNYRGSTGYGKAYKDAQRGLWGEGELRDGLGAVEYLAARHPIDRGRVVAWGGSSGGYAVLYALTRAPDRFAAGVCLYGISDLPSLAEDTHRFERYYNDALLGPLPEAWALQRERSPLYHAEDVRAPLLIMHGGKDTDVPIDQSERFVERLKRAGKEYEYHVYPEEGHGWQRAATVLDYIERMDRFLLRHVLLRAR